MTMKEKLLELQAQKKQLIDQRKQALLDGMGQEEYAALEQKSAEVNAQIDRLKALISEEEQGGEIEPPAGKPIAQQKTKPQGDVSEESMKSFAAAFRAGFKGMNEGTGADGGYTVPQDIVTKVETLREATDSLRSEIRIEAVKTNSGSRTYKTRAQMTGFTKVNEGAAIGALGGPKFSKINYSVEKYGGVLPITNELLEDSDEAIVDICAEWLAADSNAGWNNQILAVVQAQSEVALSGLDGIRKALCVTLGAAFRKTAKIYTNDDGMFWLSQLKDLQGRYLVQESLAEPGVMRLSVGTATYPIVQFSNDTMPTVDCKIPFILGDLYEGIQGFDRKQLTLKSTDVGAIANFNAFEEDMTLIRATERYQVKLRDAAAIVNGYVDGSSVLDNADLKTLTIGSLTLTPTFAKGTTTYTAATTDASNKVTAAAFDADATITILNGSTPVTNGQNASWSAGENTLTITVTAGAVTKTYTVTVTKS